MSVGKVFVKKLKMIEEKIVSCGNVENKQSFMIHPKLIHPSNPASGGQETLKRTGYRQKIISREGSSTNQSPIYIGLRKQL